MIDFVSTPPTVRLPILVVGIVVVVFVVVAVPIVITVVPMVSTGGEAFPIPFGIFFKIVIISFYFNIYNLYKKLIEIFVL